MRRYETIFIVRPNVAEDEIEAITSKTSSIIEGDGGTIIRINNWGLKKLAYLIKKENQGYYVYVDFASIPASVAEMERIFRIDDRILKYLTVKLSDSCDPEAVKEQLASAEPATTSDDPEVVKEQSASAEPAATSDDPEAVKEQPASAEPAATSDEPEPVKEQPASAEPAATSDEKDVGKNESDNVEKEKTD
jgi:small subunit ribosomal protein S6